MILQVLKYNLLSDKVRVFRQMKHPGFWLVKLYVTNGEETIEAELRNLQSAHLNEFYDIVADEFSKMIGELSPVTNGGYEVFFLKR